MKSGINCVLLLSALSSAVSVSGITVAGIAFEDNAFADVLVGSSGNYTASGGTLSQVLTDKDPGTYAFSFDTGAYVQLGFTDNLLVNGPGADLAIFELGTPPDTFILSLTLGGTTINYASQPTGIFAGANPINVAKVNLDDFGVANGASLNGVVIGLSIRKPVGNGQETVPTLSLVGALNSSNIPNVPDGGSTLALCGISALGFLGASRVCRGLGK